MEWVTMRGIKVTSKWSKPSMDADDYIFAFEVSC